MSKKIFDFLRDLRVFRRKTRTCLRDLRDFYPERRQ